VALFCERFNTRFSSRLLLNGAGDKNLPMPIALLLNLADTSKAVGLKGNKEIWGFPATKPATGVPLSICGFLITLSLVFARDPLK
jgi:hypothetical protein